MKKNILILDDDEDILFVCTYLLEEIGWKVHTRLHCNDIVNMVRSVNPSIILMDNWIPDLGGVAATQALKADAVLKSIPIIFFSANSDIKNLSEQAGADTFLPKPFDIADLENIIKQFE